MKQNLPVLLFLALAFAGCKTNENEGADVTSATVQPSNPTSLAPGSGATAGSHDYSGYAGTTDEAAAAAATGTSTAATPSGVQTTYSGLQYEVLRPGTGRSPSSFNKVKVHYKGYLLNGTTFDSSYSRGKPAIFGVTQVIPGWTEGLQLMKEGAKYRFTIPPHIAYGAAGSPPKIGPNETLKFDVELLEVLY